MLAKHLSDIRKLRGVFVQRGNFVVSFVAELPANRGTYTVCKISRHFASVVGWLHACVSVVSFAHPQLGEHFFGARTNIAKKPASFSQLASFCPPLVAGSRKRLPFPASAVRGSALSTDAARTSYELVARGEPQTPPGGGFRVCVS